MTLIKKWIPMLALAIILLPIIKVNASSYVAKNDIIIDTKYYDFFKNQFGDDNTYQFFAYNCIYGSSNRTCYYGIDNNNNYVKIDYKYIDNYNYSLNISKGVDNDFSVSGDNIINVRPSKTSILVYCVVFIFVFYVIYIMLGVVFL